MDSRTYNVLMNIKKAIEADPLAWAKQDHAEFADTFMGSMPRRTPSDNELLANAADKLSSVNAMLAEVKEISEPQMINWDANARTRDAIDNLNS